MSHGQTEARERALELGIAIRHVVRSCPVFSQMNRTMNLELHGTTCYSVSRRSQSQFAKWAFLQRTKQVAQYQHCWHFDSPLGTPPPSLDAILSKIASEWDGEFLEFEASEEEVCAFWQEWGGAGMTNRIYEYLTLFSQI